MTDRESSPSADELADAVAELGETQEDQLSTVDERNASLEERLPDDELLAASSGTPADASAHTADPTPAEGSPEQG